MDSYDQQQQQDQQQPQVSFDEIAANIQNQLIEYQHQQQDAAEKMQALQTYVQKYGARIDVNHKSKYTPQAEQPNLGTAVPSWYYLDGRGNKIFVQDMNFENALQHSKGGRGMSSKQSHAFQQQDTVIVVPRAKRNPAWHAEYLRRCEEYEAARRRLRTANHMNNAGRVAIPEGHRLIGDGLPQGHSSAFDSTGRKQGEGSLWGVRQSQAKILGGSPRKAITSGRSTNNNSSSLVPYQQPQLQGSYGSSNNASGIIPAVMVDPNSNNNAAADSSSVNFQQQSQQQQQQQQQYFDPAAGSNTNTNSSTAALQEEAARLLAQLGQR